MTLSELFAERNFFTSEALLPLTKIHSQQDKDAAREKGFAPVTPTMNGGRLTHILMPIKLPICQKQM